jgi:hypothetical protein
MNNKCYLTCTDLYICVFFLTYLGRDFLYPSLHHNNNNNNNNNLKANSVFSDILYNVHCDTGSYPYTFYHIVQIMLKLILPPSITCANPVQLCAQICSKINVNQYYVQSKIILLNCHLSACFLACLYAYYSFIQTQIFQVQKYKFRKSKCDTKRGRMSYRSEAVF